MIDRYALALEALVFEHLASPYLVLNAEMCVEAANAACRALFGIENEQWLAQKIDQIPCLSACSENISALVEDLHLERERHSPPFRLASVAEAGSALPSQFVQIHASLLDAPRGHLIVLRFDNVAAEDDRGIDEHILQFEEVLEFAGVGAWQFDVHTGVLLSSERCRADLGASEASELSIDKLLGSDPGRIAASWKDLAAGRPFEYVWEADAAKAHRWVLVRGIGQFHARGGLRSVIGFTSDITARKDHELELDERAASERVGRERSEEMARTMDHFVSAVSHEIRSPLNAIVSWAELLHLVADPQVVARAGEAIRRNGRQLAHMVDDLLDSGAVATGKLSVNLQPVDLGALTAIVAEDMRKTIEQKGLKLQTTDIGSCVAPADDSRMRQVIANLLSNAFKFTDSGSIHVSVAATNSHAVIEVRDSGRGIPPDALPLVFERFQQFADRPSGRAGGLGLGLWLVKQIIALHHGTIDVFSEGLGRGATFTVHLPIAGHGSF